MKFIDIVNDYMSFIELKGKPQSIRSVKSRINNYILPYLKDYNNEDIDKNLYIN